MTPWGPRLSYLFIKSRKFRGIWRERWWYISPTLQTRIMDAFWTHNNHQISTWPRQRRISAKLWPRIGENKMRLKNTIWANYVKRAAHIIKRGRSYDNIIYTVANLLSFTKITDDSNDFVLQAITPLSSDTLKDAFFHLGVNIRNFFPTLRSERSLWIVQWGGVRISLNME